MIKRSFTITNDKGTVFIQRVNKTTARKAYEAGKRVYAYPCNVNPESCWYAPCLWLEKEENDWDKAINYFIYYNCNKEVGKYLAYYIEY